MKSFRIGIALIAFIVYGVSSIQPNELEDTNDDSLPLPFQDQIEEVFDAFAKGDIVRMEESFKYLENIDPDEFNKLEDSNQTADYRRERIDYVVRLHINQYCISFAWKTKHRRKFDSFFSQIALNRQAIQSKYIKS